MPAVAEGHRSPFAVTPLCRPRTRSKESPSDSAPSPKSSSRWRNTAITSSSSRASGSTRICEWAERLCRASAHQPQQSESLADIVRRQLVSTGCSRGVEDALLDKISASTPVLTEGRAHHSGSDSSHRLEDRVAELHASCLFCSEAAKVQAKRVDAIEAATARWQKQTEARFQAKLIRLEQRMRKGIWNSSSSMSLCAQNAMEPDATDEMSVGSSPKALTPKREDTDAVCGSAVAALERWVEERFEWLQNTLELALEDGLSSMQSTVTPLEPLARRVAHQEKELLLVQNTTRLLTKRFGRAEERMERSLEQLDHLATSLQVAKGTEVDVQACGLVSHVALSGEPPSTNAEMLATVQHLGDLSAVVQGLSDALEGAMLDLQRQRMATDAINVSFDQLREDLLGGGPRPMSIRSPDEQYLHAVQRIPLPSSRSDVSWLSGSRSSTGRAESEPPANRQAPAANTERGEPPANRQAPAVDTERGRRAVSSHSDGGSNRGLSGGSRTLSCTSSEDPANAETGCLNESALRPQRGHAAAVICRRRRGEA